MFAALAQHLGTALVPLNVDTAHWTLFDGRVGVVVSADPVTGKISQTHFMGALRDHECLFTRPTDSIHLE